jgi:hypothetical protein
MSPASSVGEDMGFSKTFNLGVARSIDSNRLPACDGEPTRSGRCRDHLSGYIMNGVEVTVGYAIVVRLAVPVDFDAPIWDFDGHCWESEE